MNDLYDFFDIDVDEFRNGIKYILNELNIPCILFVLLNILPIIFGGNIFQLLL